VDRIERQRQHFESISQQYYASRRATTHLLVKNLTWEYFLGGKEFLKKEGLTVLEPMCGYAEGKTILEQHLGVRIDYDGFDYSDSLVRMVREHDPTLNVSTMDITRYEPSREYDLLILLSGLHHVPHHVEQVLTRLRGALREGGFFLVYEPTHNNWLFKKIRDRIYERNALFDRETEQAFELARFNELFLSKGFSIVDQIYPGLLSYVLYYNPDAFPLLNVGGARLARWAFAMDKRFFRNVVGRKLSFATLTLWQKRGKGERLVAEREGKMSGS
jgi:SAM-dependent methyltransferase